MEIEYRLPYIVRIETLSYPKDKRVEMWKWCIEMYGKNNNDVWSWDGESTTLDTFYFKDEKIATMFILRWA